MSQNGKVISFGKPVAPEPQAKEPEETETPISEMEAAVVDMATFLLDNKDRIQNFVCGIACATEVFDDDEIDTEFHLITSPIDARDYALALRLFEDGFRRNLGGAVEE